jgi:phosphoribosylformylglycinamidine synthase
MLRNSGLKFVCRHVYLKSESGETPFTASCRHEQILRIPIAHNEGNFFLAPEELTELENNHQVLFRYSDESGDVNAAANPNGSINNIAGVMNRNGNVMGLMPHPERASELLLGCEDGRQILQSMIDWNGV